MTQFKTILLAAASLAIAGAAVGGASAATYVQATHPARAEINHRLAVQTHRIRVERREGLISPQKAAYLHRQDRLIRHEERADARLHHGRLARVEQRHLNRRLNHVSREIVR